MIITKVFCILCTFKEVRTWNVIAKKDSMKNMLLILFIMSLCFSQSDNTHFDKLTSLFKEWRTFENPPMLNGAPDYTRATFNKRLPKFKELQKKLNSFNTKSWTVQEKSILKSFKQK